ncbi:zinc finger-containing ubiquitin peptidase 1 isoform X2 [Danio rerio]|uniref:Zinc finger-containing ubiquitin peptidase 1 n=1 Tax=Danio rerio TaxID=7955 RepID=A0A8M2B580_DANRE|nr:zinc finger with UFM1-specific peptidase domain protein isoform X2 [Danio rerio]|eukprot:XP_005158410.1 zinc finger with UFM1-specific peptidase domain protein isoform X2 [Danio rerio]
MPVCDICCEELLSEAEMKTHLLLSHMENLMACPFCSLSGVSYDELSFHINTAHTDKDYQDTNVTMVNSGQKNDCITKSTSNVNATNTCKASHQLLPQVNGTATQITGTSHSQGPSASRKSSPPAAATANGAIKLVRTTQTPSNYTRRKSEDGHQKSKQKRLSSPFKEGCFPCPMCNLVYSDCFALQEHVEIHLQDQDAGHSPGEDLTLARKLQEEEEQNWREVQTRREAEDFKKLQKQFGLDNSGGYRKQMERNLDRAVSRGQMLPADFHRKRAEMLESLASGVDDGRSKTSGLMEALYRYYQRDASDCAHVWLCAETDHYSSSEGDKGWGCGYRNFQMLLSSLHRMEQYKHLPVSVPSIPRVQALMEEAWAQGADPQGASHFNNRLQGTRAWIGATEIYAVLTSLSVKARIVDFHKPTGPRETHPRLFEWVKQYFTHSTSRGARLPPKVVQTTLPPVYLQHQGHSRSIIGMEEKANGKLCLLFFDPGVTPAEMKKVLSQDTVTSMVQRMRKYTSGLKHKQYQVVIVEGVLTAEEKQSRILNSRTLRAEKIP